MDLDDAQTWAQMMMDEHGLLDSGWTLAWDNARCRAGVCRYRTKTISLSRCVTLQSSEDRLMDTVAHEVAHALVGHGHGHDGIWRATATALGGSGARCYTGQPDPTAPWTGTCSHGQQFNRYRTPYFAVYRCACIVDGRRDHSSITWQRRPAAG